MKREKKAKSRGKAAFFMSKTASKYVACVACLWYNKGNNEEEGDLNEAMVR